MKLHDGRRNKTRQRAGASETSAGTWARVPLAVVSVIQALALGHASCELGQYVSTNNNACTNCPKGYYQDQEK